MRMGHMNDTFADLFAPARMLKAAKGQVIISPDEEPRGVCYIVSGYVKTYNISDEGETQLIAISGPGDLFPLHWALNAQRRPVFYETLSDIEFKLLPKAEFKAQIMDSTSYLRAALEMVLASFTASQERIHNLEFRMARKRLTFRLLFLAERFGERHGNTVDIAVPITYQDLADSLSITRETVNRSMSQLIKEGLVTRTDHHLAINKLAELKAILGDDNTLKI